MALVKREGRPVRSPFKRASNTLKASTFGQCDEKFVKDGKFSGRVVRILTHPSFLFDKLPRLGLKDFKLSLLDTEIFSL